MTSFQKLDCKMLDFLLKTRACMQDIQASARYTNEIESTLSKSVR